MATWYTGTIWRGVDYSPTWPTWVVGAANTQTNDSDFANDAFASLWAGQYQAPPQGDPSQPVNNGGNYRNDLKTIAALGFNLVRLYDWDMARGTSASSGTGLDHINFLNYAGSLGLKVVVPVGDYFLSDEEYAWNGVTPSSTYSFSSAPGAVQTDFSQFVASIIDPATGHIHSAIHSIEVGNEGDIGQGIMSPYTTTPSNFLARTIWWIYNLHLQINGTGTGPDGYPVANGPSPIVPLSATFSNADQGGSNGSWFNCLISGVSAGQPTPSGCNLGPQFAMAVPGLSAVDASYATYYYNSFNVSQVSTTSPYPNTLASTLADYDSGASPWPGAKLNVPLLMMEVFTPNRTQYNPTTDQAVAAVGQAKAIEGYLADNSGGTSASTTNLMGYNYFEFNDEQQVKLTGLYQYGATSQNAQTGTTSVSYPPYAFPNMTFPVGAFTATPGPGGIGSLASAWTACFPQAVVEGTIVAASGSPGSWQATFYQGTELPPAVVPKLHARGKGIPAGTTVESVPTANGRAPRFIAMLTNASTAGSNPFTANTETCLYFARE